MERTKKTEKGPDQIIFQGHKAGTVCSRFFIFLLLNRLAVCLGVHAAPRYSGYCTESSQTNFALWVSVPSVSMLHNREGLSINRSSSNKCQPLPVDKYCFSTHTNPVSPHVHTMPCCTYTLCLPLCTHTVSETEIAVSFAFIFKQLLGKKIASYHLSEIILVFNQAARVQLPLGEQFHIF